MPLPAPPGPALYLLGGIALRGIPAEDADRLLSQSKVIALLALLALAPKARFQRRDRLVGLLWPELDQPHARGALRKALHASRLALGADAFITRGDEEIALADQSLWCDVVELRTATDSGQLARAVELYHGDLMPGFHLPECSDFDFWLEEQRAATLERVVAAAWALAEMFESDDKRTPAVQMAKLVARLAHDERVLRRSLVMLDRLGDRAGALRLFDRFARRLRAELQAEPSAETMALIDKMRTPPSR